MSGMLYHTATLLAAILLTLFWSDSLLHVAEQVVREVEIDPVEWGTEPPEEPVPEEESTDEVELAETEPTESEETAEEPQQPQSQSPPEAEADAAAPSADQADPKEVATSPAPTDATSTAQPTVESTANPLTAATQESAVEQTTDITTNLPPQAANPPAPAAAPAVPSGAVSQLLGGDAGTLSAFAGDSPTGASPASGDGTGTGGGPRMSFDFVGSPGIPGPQTKSPLQPVMMRQTRAGIEVAVILGGWPGQPQSLADFRRDQPRFDRNCFVRLPAAWMGGFQDWAIAHGRGWAAYVAVEDRLFQQWMQQAEEFAADRQQELQDLVELKGELRFPDRLNREPRMRFLQLTARPPQTPEPRPQDKAQSAVENNSRQNPPQPLQEQQP